MKVWKLPLASSHVDPLSEVTIIMKHKDFVILFLIL